VTTDDTARAVQTASLHGRSVAYRHHPGPTASDVPILLIHGMGSSTRTWVDIPERLAAGGVGVLVVDLPGHGDSSRGRGDYSLGSMASALRDLLDHLGIARVHLVGHSLGGGITLQFHYQFPERVETVTLVSSGGLGEEVFPVLRAATLPGADLVIRAAINRRTLAAAEWLGRSLERVGVRARVLQPHALETAGWLAEEDRRIAFLSTVRSVIDPGGQRVCALDTLDLLHERRVLIVWGDRDPMIPVAHGLRAHELIPGSRLVVFPGAGHEPHAFDPARFTDELLAHVRGGS